MLLLPDIVNTPALVRRALKPRPGERILEVGPGDGRMAVRAAQWIGASGTLDILDVQQSMLDLTMRRAQRNGLTNLNPTKGEAGAELPYPDGTFDAAYLITVLGEIPDREAALEQLRRVVRPGGRLVVGEFFLDPDFIPRRQLRAHAEAVGFRLVDAGGPPFAYLARFETPTS
jgi:ubiquinone/menaquinone biosynthesis C-methylase UbiE